MVMIDESNATAAAVGVKSGVLPGPAATLAEAVCRVMEAVGYIQKDKQMSGGGNYRYASVEAVIDALRPEMIRHRLVLLPCGIETMHQGEHGRQVHLRVRYSFKLMHAPSGQSEVVVVVGEGMDVGDKSGNKAMTAARKYALIMAFNIETGLDPDDTSSASQQKPAAAQQPPQQAAKPAQQQAPSNAKLRAEVVQKLAQAKTADDYHRIRKQIGKDYTDKLLTKADIDAINPIAAETMNRLGIKAQPAAK